MTIELSEYLLNKIADAVVKKMQEPSYNSIKSELEPCKDCISREDAINQFVEWYSDLMETQKEEVNFKDVLKDLPSVTPQPKMGRWIMSDDGLYRPICNNCGAHPWKGYIPTVEEATDVFKYCPNCGSYNGGEE